MSSDLLQEPAFVRERPTYVPMTASWSPGKVQAAGVILGRCVFPITPEILANSFPGVSRAGPWRSRAVGKKGFQFSIIRVPAALPCLKLLLPLSPSLHQRVHLSYCPSLGPRVSSACKE